MGLCPSRNVERDRDSIREEEEARENENVRTANRGSPEVSPSTLSTGITTLATVEEGSSQSLPSLTEIDHDTMSIPVAPQTAENGIIEDFAHSTEASSDLPGVTPNGDEASTETETFFSNQSQILVVVLPRRSPTDRPRVILVVFENSNHNHEEAQFQNILNQLFQSARPKTHPASSQVLKMLPETCVDEELLKKAPRCVICCEEFSVGQSVVRMPCDHIFEKSCVEPWLKENNTCPVCRYELPVEDAEYESQRRQRMKQSRGEIDEATFFGQTEEVTAENDGKAEQPDL